MYVRVIVFLGVTVCFPVLMSGISHSRTGLRLVAHNVAKLIKLKPDVVRPVAVSKEIVLGERSSIAVSQEEGHAQDIFTNYLNVKHIDQCMVTLAFYMRSKNKQYASLACDNNTLRLLAHIKDSLHEGTDVCTHNGETIKEVTAILTRPDTSLNGEFNKRFERRTERWTPGKDHDWLFGFVKLKSDVAFKKYNFKGLIIDPMLDWNTGSFKLHLDPDYRESHYHCSQREYRDPYWSRDISLPPKD